MILKELSQMNGKYVIIGTPCQISALRKYEKQNRSLSEKIFLRICFFCGGAPNLNAYDYYMKAHGIDVRRVRSIYRGLGWPGNNVFELDSGETICIPRRPETFLAQIYHTLAFFPIFAQKRCLLCNDRFGTSSDISVGDAWLEEYKSDKLGVSLIVSRSSTVRKILFDMQQEKALFLKEATEDQLIQSQKIFSDYVDNYPTTCRVLLGRKYFNRHFCAEKPRLNLLWGMKISLVLLGMKLSRIKGLWPYLFIYGIIFRYGYQWLSLAELLKKKIDRHFVVGVWK
ncbi:Coenzyme F420 hydrogenase/dehydrogenase, beta subunit C-terminal domain [Methanoculleus sp.]|jgi:coenzyme F420-reducing hydrogenase beta subunit|uniref:Coenzyme F420 hydrogenase/dehydrogenase, beta subunit C-terminal domain n=1 Tax=Methanoculleus sp. TaxID=90427 RepID=UPI00262C43A6|nr:Coenzyme F420 hydrogenase/dehydrogenase, beta subunit C-terminal domain [Methanoculleus sp.]